MAESEEFINGQYSGSHHASSGRSNVSAGGGRRLPPIVRVMVIFSLALAAGGAVFLLLPVRELMARAEGYVIVVDEPVRRVAVPAGGHARLAFRLTNVTSRSVTVDGVESLCGCTFVEPVPVAIPALESAVLTVSFNMEGRAAGTTYRWDPRVFVDCPSPEIRLVVDVELK